MFGFTTFDDERDVNKTDNFISKIPEKQVLLFSTKSVTVGLFVSTFHTFALNVKCTVYTSQNF